MPEKKLSDYKLLLLNDQPEINKERFEFALSEARKMVEIYYNRDEYIIENELEENVFFPAPPWDQAIITNSIFFEDKAVEEEIFQQFRFATFSFSGLSLIRFGGCLGMPPYPEFYDENVFDKEFMQKDMIDLQQCLKAYLSLTSKIDKKYIIKIPNVLGEIGWDVDGGVVNPDVALYQHVITDMIQLGLIKWIESKIERGEKVRILEIGGGWGMLAYMIKSIFPQDEIGYFICDIPETLPISSFYLNYVMPGKVNFIPNYEMENYPNEAGEFDLVIATSTMCLIPNEQIEYYGDKIIYLIGQKGCFYEVSIDNREAFLVGGTKGTYGKEYFRVIFPHEKKSNMRLPKGEASIWANNKDVIDGIIRENFKDNIKTKIDSISNKGRLQDPEIRKDKITLIATLPRSGTLSLQYFFYFYNEIYKGKDWCGIDLSLKVSDIFNLFSFEDSLGLDFLHISHSLAPEFEVYLKKYPHLLEIVFGKESRFWDGNRFLNDNADKCYLSRNKEIRFIYVFRNPLDHAVSLFNHLQGHRNGFKTGFKPQYYDKKKNVFRTAANTAEFFFSWDLDSFMCQYISWVEAKKVYPENITFMTYENMVRNKRKFFNDMFNIIGLDPEDDLVRRNIIKTLELSDIEHMKDVESKKGKSLAGDQIDSSYSHIKSGAIGQWREHFSKKDLKLIEKQFNEYDVSLNDFDLGVDGDVFE